MVQSATGISTTVVNGGQQVVLEIIINSTKESRTVYAYGDSALIEVRSQACSSLRRNSNSC